MKLFPKLVTNRKLLQSGLGIYRTEQHPCYRSLVEAVFFDRNDSATGVCEADGNASLLSLGNRLGAKTKDLNPRVGSAAAAEVGLRKGPAGSSN